MQIFNTNQTYPADGAELFELGIGKVKGCESIDKNVAAIPAINEGQASS